MREPRATVSAAGADSGTSAISYAPSPALVQRCAREPGTAERLSTVTCSATMKEL